MLATQNGQLLRNAGRSESKGMELSLQGNPMNGLMIQLNYGFTHAKFKDYKDDKKGINYFTKEQIELLSKNEYVIKVSEKSITYSDEYLDKVIGWQFTESGAKKSGIDKYIDLYIEDLSHKKQKKNYISFIL